MKRTKYISIGTMSAALLNVILNILIIPYFGFVGASYTTLVGYVFLFFVHYKISNHFMGVDVIGNQFIKRWSTFMVVITAVFIATTNFIVIRYSFALILIIYIVFRYKESIKKIIQILTERFNKKRGS